MQLTDARCLIVGEIAQAHDGSLGMAHAYIDAVAAAGADAVKFQTHIADAESGPEEPFRVRFSYQDDTRYGYWKRLEFTEDQWRGLARHAEDKGLYFLSSPFSLAALDLLERIGVPAWKVASGEIANWPLIDRMAAGGKPVLLSCGMSPLEELDAAVARVRRAGAPLAVMQCTTAYPCPPERVGLNLLEEFRARYGLPVGLSDHSGTIFPGLAAAAGGLAVLEVHVTFHRGMFGPDVPASLTPEELKTLVDGVRFIETMRANPVDKTASGGAYTELRAIFMQGLVAARDLAAGETLESADLATRKPLKGIPASDIDRVVGRRLARPLPRGAFLSDADLAPAGEAVSAQ